MRRAQARWPIAALMMVSTAAVGCSDDTGGPGAVDTGVDVGFEVGDAGYDTDLGDGGGDGDGAGTTLSLEPGEAAEIPLLGGVGGTVIDAADDETYLLVLASTRFDYRGEDYDYTVAIGVEPTEPATGTLLESCSLTDASWRDQTPEAEEIPAGEPPEVGDERQFEMSTSTGVELITARVTAVGDGAVVWEDVTEAHTADLDGDFVDEFLTDFDDVILPRERSIFGIESDIDDDGRIALLFTPLTYETAVAFFSGCDLLPEACSASNGGEVLYLTPPNTIPPPYNTPNAIKEILAHELQHLIHFNRALLRNGLERSADNSYMLEGFGALAQDVSGYQAGNFYVTKAGLELIDDFRLGDVLEDYGRYDDELNGVLRGGSYLFVRWLYDRAGGDDALEDGSVESRGGPMLLRALMESSESAAATLPEVAESPLSDLAMDFYTAVGASNRDEVGEAAPSNPCFQYLPTVADPITDRQRGANMYAEFHGQAMSGPATQSAESPDGSLLAGGVEYLILEPDAGDTEISFTVDVDPMAIARLRVVRIR